MNCPSRTDNPDGREGWNQSPNLHSGTTREDFNGMANARVLRRIETGAVVATDLADKDEEKSDLPRPRKPVAVAVAVGLGRRTSTGQGGHEHEHVNHVNRSTPRDEGEGYCCWCLPRPPSLKTASIFSKAREVLLNFGKFVGPGFMISVAYIDPGNYATDVAAGASHKFQLLFIVLLSNIIAIYLQSLCIKLGTVSGMDLAQMCRAHLPSWLNITLYIMAECAIIATDIAEVIGTAIALNLLFPQLPVVAGCALSICDVLLILLFYRPNGSMKGLRAFELFVIGLVLGVVICFCYQLGLIKEVPVGDVFRGYLPSADMLKNEGLYQACGILGATVMPHSLYLGSGIVQPRLLEYDIKAGHVAVPSQARSISALSSEKAPYQPSLAAIRFCLKYSIVELALSLFTFALFVNSAILIVAGSSLDSNTASDASLFGIHKLLSDTIAPAAGTIFALALLLSGISAGIVCTIAGQMVSEGALNWSLAPWLRRLITRSISITPSIIIAGAVGKDGLTKALNGSQVALSVVLPFVSAPVIYFTCRNKFMSVKARSSGSGAEMDAHGDGGENERSNVHDMGASGDGTATEMEVGMGARDGDVKMRNHWATTAFAVLIWLVIASMNVANLVLLRVGG